MRQIEYLQTEPINDHSGIPACCRIFIGKYVGLSSGRAWHDRKIWCLSPFAFLYACQTTKSHPDVGNNTYILPGPMCSCYK